MQGFELNAMSQSSVATRALKAVVHVIAGVGALAAALTLAFLITVLFGRVTSVYALTALVWVITCLATLTGSALVMKRLVWPWRAALGVLLLAVSFVLLPHHNCVEEPSARTGC